MQSAECQVCDAIKMFPKETIHAPQGAIHETLCFNSCRQAIHKNKMN